MVYPATEATCWIIPSFDVPQAMDDSLTEQLPFTLPIAM